MYTGFVALPEPHITMMAGTEYMSQPAIETTAVVGTE